MVPKYPRIFRSRFRFILVPKYSTTPALMFSLLLFRYLARPIIWLCPLLVWRLSASINLSIYLSTNQSISHYALDIANLKSQPSFFTIIERLTRRLAIILLGLFFFFFFFSGFPLFVLKAWISPAQHGHLISVRNYRCNN